MNIDLDLGEWIVVALSAFLFIWYFVASSMNRRKGIATSRWLYKSLEKVGEISDAQWIGSSNTGAKLVVERASKPFRRVEVLYLLEPREFLPYWVFSRMRGKRDEVRITATLRAVPKQTIEITRGTDRRSKTPPPGDHQQTLVYDQTPEGFLIAHHRQEDTRMIDQLKAFLTESGAAIHRISIRRESPHLEISARIKPLLLSPAESYFTTLQTWFQDK